MVKSATLGMPRIGSKCEVSNAVHNFIHKKINQNELQAIGKKVREENLKIQKDANIDIIPSNDFTFFDHVLDATVLLGNIPRKYYWEGGSVSLDIYFTMITGQQREKFDVTPMNIARWFNTNYLYVVPEFSDPAEFVYSDNKHVLAYLEAKQKFDIKTRPVFFGPISYLLMGKVSHEDSNDINKLHLIDDMLPVYDELFINCKRLGITDIQFDEPMLTQDLTRGEQAVYRDFYNKLSEKAGTLKMHLVTSYGDIGNNLECAMSLPVESIHLDLVTAPNQLDQVLELLPEKMLLSLGLVDSNNIWINDLNKSIEIVRKVVNKIGSNRVIVAPSASLFLCPIDVDLETQVPQKLDGLLSFTKQKVNEVSIITKVVNGDQSFDAYLLQNKEKIEKLSKMSQILEKKGQEKLKTILNKDYNRKSVFNERIKLQKKEIFGDNAPLMPITLNGKMPFSSKTDLDQKDCIEKSIKMQEDLDIDIICDGELDRNNNTEFLAKNLEGVFVPEYGFVQHYGTTFNTISIIYDNLIAKKSIYEDAANFVLGLTKKPVKIAISGPISFVSQSCILPNVSEYAVQILVADIIKNEIANLEKLGVKIIGIDEQSFLQSVPLRSEHIADEITKIVDIFKYTCSDIQDKTQIHTKILHAHFDEFLEDFARLDSDVLLINSSRLNEEIFESFISYRYPNHISLGIYDSWSERIPVPQEISLMIKKYNRSLEYDQIWISPDIDFCKGSKDRFLKTMNIIIVAVKEFRANHV